MKQYSYLMLWVGLVLVLWVGCDEPGVVFKSPQPEGLRAEPFINPVFRGKFICDSDSSVVYIKNDIIYKEKLYAFEVTTPALDTLWDLEMRGDRLYSKKLDQYMPMFYKDDTIRSRVRKRDTLFLMGENHILKSFKGNQILNRKLDNRKWEVFILSLDDQFNLRLFLARLPENIHALKAITRVEDISTREQVQIRIRPTVMEFEEILNQELIFDECDIFYRVEVIHFADN